MSLLKVEQLTKRFGGLTAVNKVSFGVDECEIVGLIGPNGAGKTTVFNLITGFEVPDEGTIMFGGNDVTGLTPPHRVTEMGIARTFQVVKPFRTMSVLENVMVGCFLKTSHYNVAKDRALEILDFVGMFRERNIPAKELSLPGRKRLEVARALATNPRLVLLDEVAAGLNPAELKEIIQVVEKVSQSGVAVLMIEHIMAVVMSICQRIVVLHHGNKIAEGKPSNIARDPAVIEAYLGEEYLIA